MRPKAIVILTAVLSVLIVFLAINYFRSTPSSSAAGVTSTSPLYGDRRLPSAGSTVPEAGQLAMPINANSGPTSPSPITVMCGNTLITVEPAPVGEARAVKVDCGQLGLTPHQPMSTSAYLEEPVAQPAVYRARRGTPTYYSDGRERPRYRKHRRSFAKEALIVGGSAGAGTAIGALAGGKKGAAIGAVSGGVAGLAYDLATRNK